MNLDNPATDDVDLGPIIDERQRDRIHSMVTGSVAAGATLRTGGTYDGLFYRPTVLTGAGPGTPAYDSEVFGPVARSSGSPRPAKPSIWRQTVSTGST